MIYNANSCQICAVTFKTSRLRLPHEPPEDIFGNRGTPHYSRLESKARCSLLREKSGCSVVRNYGHGNYFIHFPGRGCSFQGGYSGLRIGADEMKGMILPRYIVLKPSGADLENEKQEQYEWKSRYFVTSQTKRPHRGVGPADFASVRFGIDEVSAQKYTSSSDEECWGVPVHDACWKIFERVSKLRLGEVDLEGFMALWNRQACGNCGFQNLKQDYAIAKSKGLFWNHIPGTEYLAANPHDIPGFPVLLLEHSSGQVRGDGVFDGPQPRPNRYPTVVENLTDNFTKMPAELKNMVLSYLTSKDIAALRLASRSFRQLPQSVFKRLVQDELPWFWEYSDLKELELQSVLRSEDVKDDPFISRANWMEIYKDLLVAKGGVLGVKNRVRVWNLAEEITRRIAELNDRFVREGIELNDLPSDEEVEAELVKSASTCPRCESFQIQAHYEDMEEEVEWDVEDMIVDD